MGKNYITGWLQQAIPPTTRVRAPASYGYVRGFELGRDWFAGTESNKGQLFSLTLLPLLGTSTRRRPEGSTN